MQKSPQIIPKGFAKTLGYYLRGFRRVQKAIFQLKIPDADGTRNAKGAGAGEPNAGWDQMSPGQIQETLESLRTKMWTLARDEKFEKAAKVRDQLQHWEKLALAVT